MTRGKPRRPRPDRTDSAFPVAEPHVNPAFDEDDEAERVIDAWLVRGESGDAFDPEEEIRAHPQVAQRLRDGLGALRLLSRTYGDATAASLAGRTLGNWRLDSVLGSGGMGTVYLATAAARGLSPDAGSRVAIKFIHPHLAERTGFFERFLREAEIGRRVRHANVVRTLDVDEFVDGTTRRHFLVMEYVEGRTLRALLAEVGSVPEALCRHIGREVAAALAAIHAAGAVHRDLKPDNVLVTNDHVVKVMDLGVARLADEAVQLSQTGSFVGSLLYGAPEQFDGAAEIDARADLHALGLLLYELVTGVHPFAHDDFRVVIRRIANDVPRRLGEIDPQIAPFFEEVVHALLAKKPEDRLASAEELLRVLDAGEESDWWRDRSKAIRRVTQRPMRRIRIPRETALFGRETELAKLHGLYERAKSGDGQVVLIEGEAGIGKSRLVDEFALTLWGAGERFDFLFGSYPPGGAATASGAFSTAYREHFGGDEAAIRDALPQTPLLVAAFAALLRGDAAPEGAEHLTKDSLQTLFVHATRSLAARRPTIVLIEDLHFAPDEGRALFASLALAVPGHRILLVAATRPGLDEQWVGQLVRQPQTTRLALPRLGPKELIHMLRDALQSERLAEELAALIAVKSDGNPFFVFELLRGLRDGHSLEQRPDGTWETTRIIRDIQVPSSIQELVQARVADLDEEDRNVLDVASCLGFEFDPLLVGAVLGRPQIPLMRRLGRIERRHRLVRSAGRRFVFDHHQVQEALYAGMPELLREPYHLALAQAIESRERAAERDPKSLDGALCVDLAEHFLKGASGRCALRYLDPALTHLEKGCLNDAAVRLADGALAVPGLLAARERCEVLLRRAGRLDLLGRSDEELRCLEEASALADAAGEASLRARARVSLGLHLRHVALAIARETGSRRDEASALGNLGNDFDAVGRFDEARAHHERHLAISREIGDRRGEAMATGNLGLVLYSLGRYDEARAHHERHLAIARETGDRRSEAAATGNLGNDLNSLGRYDEARTHHERQFAIARETGDRRSEAMATGNLGNVFESLGRRDEARAHYERHLAIAREIGSRSGESTALLNLGSLWLSLGNLVRARRALEPSLAIIREIGARDAEGFGFLFLGRLADEEGHVAEALRLMGESLALRRKIGHGDGVADSLIEIADLRRRAGDAEAARTALDEALRLSREQGYARQAVVALAMLACLPGGDAQAVVAELAHASVGGYDSRTRFLLWQATRDPVHLAEARRLLDFIVEHAPPDCRETMLANVRLHREIAAAAKEHGL
jgi:serine/threonine protein kinase/tetratricopeptide (TPR) repeat protein